MAAKHLLSVMHGSGWQIYSDNYWQSKCEWLNQQHELILAMNRHALKRSKQSVEKSVSQAGSKALKIPIGNLVLLCDHPEGQNKIQDNYKSKLFIVELKHWNPNVYNIKPLCGKGLMHMVNQQQLFDLQKLMGIICYIQPLIPIYL